jgi:hypothetical protein
VLLPFDAVVRRGVILLWHQYAELDDPRLAGQTKAKYFIVLSSSPHDDPIIYLLTTSQKSKHASHPAPEDLLRIPVGAYECFQLETLVDAGTAGEREVGREQLQALYESGRVAYKGCLTGQDCAALVVKIASSARASRKVKRLLGIAPPAS